ncbi:MAG: hypothetical protein AB1492_00545 [Bacillota bacterium]
MRDGYPPSWLWIGIFLLVAAGLNLAARGTAIAAGLPEPPPVVAARRDRDGYQLILGSRTLRIRLVWTLPLPQDMPGVARDARP